MLAFALQQLRSKYCPAMRITEARGYFPTRGHALPMKTLDPDNLAPKQFSKMAEGSDDFACACVCVEFRFHLVLPYCLRLSLHR